nr:MAG TPA: hypothetical protein [Caudoviricetes sp.]
MDKKFFQDCYKGKKDSNESIERFIRLLPRGSSPHSG